MRGCARACVCVWGGGGWYCVQLHFMFCGFVYDDVHHKWWCWVKPTRCAWFCAITIHHHPLRYKTIDDREVKTDDDGDEGKEIDPIDELMADETEVNGIFFSRLASRRPELAGELRALKQLLVSETAASASEVKVRLFVCVFALRQAGVR